MKRFLINVLMLTAMVSVAWAQPRPVTKPATKSTVTKPATKPVVTKPVKPAMAPMAPVAKESAKPSVAKESAKPSVAKEPAKPAPKPSKDAKPEKTDSWWKVLLGGLINVFLLFLLAIASSLGGLLIKWLGKKMKITDTQQLNQLEMMFDALVVAGINFAKQQAYKLGDNPDAKAKRMKWAMEFVEKGIQEWGLPEKTAEWLGKKIEAKIGESERK
jgi:hypothetical protein